MPLSRTQVPGLVTQASEAVSQLPQAGWQVVGLQVVLQVPLLVQRPILPLAVVQVPLSTSHMSVSVLHTKHWPLQLVLGSQVTCEKSCKT